MVPKSGTERDISDCIVLAFLSIEHCPKPANSIVASLTFTQ